MIIFRRQHLPSVNKLNEYQMERIRFAALKLGAGRRSDLRRWVNEAKHDRRDLLMDAGFGLSLTAHKKRRIP